jgi:hypothetical protein
MVLMRLMVLWWPSNHQLVKTQVSPSVEYKLHALRKAALPSCRVGPVQSRTTLTEHLDPDNAPTERSRSSYGFSRAPQDEIPKVERKRPSSQTPSHGTSTAHAKHCDFSTPACGSDNMGSIPETEASFTTPINTTAPPEIGTCKPISTYSPHPPPPSPAYTEAPSHPRPPNTLQEPPQVQALGPIIPHRYTNALLASLTGVSTRALRPLSKRGCMSCLRRTYHGETPKTGSWRKGLGLLRMGRGSRGWEWTKPVL